MSEIASSDGVSETEKPVSSDVKFPPFPEPTDEDFDDDISAEERTYYKNKFKDLNTLKSHKLHCTSCDRHMGCSPRNERIRVHPLLRTLVCQSCHAFYNSGEFEKGDDGSELYCRWCGQGGQVYCCSECPHVFCAKCIRRNFGNYKIREIENADDWKCFKCNPDCLKDLRAICWAVLRYCDLKLKITSFTKDPQLRAAYEKDCALDHSDCCKHKGNKRNQKANESLTKKKDATKEPDTKIHPNILAKVSSTIQVKKFAAVKSDDSPKVDKKAQKRPASPKLKSLLVKNPIAIAPCGKVVTPISIPPLAKKLRLPNCAVNTTLRFPNVHDRKVTNTYSRVRPTKVTPLNFANNCFNGFAANVFHTVNPVNDNINLSLDSLTQGLDMAAMAAFSNNNTQQDDDVVCTPDFPMEPLCEVTEDNDDDVQCITPITLATAKLVNPPPLVTIPRPVTNSSEFTPENIIQMSDNDVSVNEATGGLKFRVDPQTLSSNKMYRLPDGRIFAINPNPNMPGGYSATIVAVTEANKGLPKGATFAAKVSSVSTSTPTPKPNRIRPNRNANSKRSSTKTSKSPKSSENSPRECDLSVPIEWYRYNLIDAVDALEYSLSRLQKLKTEATSVYLRTRSVAEMRNLHRTLERLLNTSSSRFNEIRDNLNKGLKEYTAKKLSENISEDDDDVEILPDMDDDPIFIDENSIDSNINSENQEVDLTGPGSSEYNDSGENIAVNISKNDHNALSESQNDNTVAKETLMSNNEKSIVDVQKKDIQNENKTNGENETFTLINDNLKCDESFDEIKDTIKRELPNNDKKIITVKNMSETKSNKQSEDEIDKKLDLSETLSDKELDSKIDEEINMCETNPNEELDVKIEQDINLLETNTNKQSEDNTLSPDDENLESEDKKKEDNDKSQDINNKIQDGEMSGDLSKTIIKEESEDNITKKSEVPALQVA